MSEITPPAEAKAHKKKEEQNELVISYLALRQCVGILGFFLPIIVIATSFILPHCRGLQNSLSDYHNTISRDLFVGILCSIALFLSVYKGYIRQDRIIALIAGILGFCVGILPTGIDESDCAIYANLSCGGDSCYNFPGWIGTLHLIVSGIFLLLLGYFSYFIFTRSDKPKSEQGKLKRRRNWWYRACGIIIAACVLILVLYFAFTDEATRLELDAKFKPVLIMEIIAVWAFAFSWLIKGETLGIMQD
ncbi:MAG: hypothetical protein ACHQFW_03930 [Chitinophagales bacterium]